MISMMFFLNEEKYVDNILVIVKNSSPKNLSDDCRLSPADCRPSVGQQLAVCQPSVVI